MQLDKIFQEKQRKNERRNKVFKSCPSQNEIPQEIKSLDNV